MVIGEDTFATLDGLPTDFWGLREDELTFLWTRLEGVLAGRGEVDLGYGLVVIKNY